MDEIKRLLKIKKNLIGLIVVLVLLVALPVGIYLAQRTQIFKPRAQAPEVPGVFTLSGPHGNCVNNTDLFSVTTPWICDAGQTISFQADGANVENISRIKLWTVELDNPSTSQIEGGNWSELNYTGDDLCNIDHPCTVFGFDYWSSNDTGKWLVIMDVYTDDGSGEQLYCTGWQDNSADPYCGSDSDVIFNVIPPDDGGGVTATPVPTQPGGIDLGLAATFPDECSAVSNSKTVTLTWTQIQTGDTYILSRTIQGVNSSPAFLIIKAQNYSQESFIDNSVNAGTYTYLLSAYHSGESTPFTTDTTTISIDCDGGGVISTPPPISSCTISGSTSLVTGQFYTFNVGGATAACQSCRWRVYQGSSPNFSDVSQVIITLDNPNPLFATYIPSQTGSQTIAFSNDGQLKATCSKQITVAGGGVPTVPGGYPTPPPFLPTEPPPIPTQPPVPTQPPQVFYACINSACQQVTDSSVGSVHSSLALCQAVCGTQPTQPPTGGITYKVANAASFASCQGALDAMTASTAWTQGTGSKTITGHALSDSSPGLKTVCAQFTVNGVKGPVLPAQINLVSSTQPTLTPTGVQTPTPTKTPTPSPTGVKATKEYKFAENLVALEAAPWLPYKTSVETTHSFTDKNPGTKQICVKFRATDNTESDPLCKTINLLSLPKIQACNITSVGDDTRFEILGENFGATQSTVKSGAVSLNILEWSDTKVVVKYQSPSLNQSIPVTLTTTDGIKAEGACSGISQLAIGAQLFCPQVKDIDIPDTEVTIAEGAATGKVFTEKATLKILKANNVGVIEGLKTKLQLGKPYKLSIKVPRGVRRVLKNTLGGFVASGKTTNIDFIKDGDGAKLPLGDIFPVNTGDGAINAADFTQLKKDIQAAKATTNSYSDLNLDNWVNSFEWACMRPEIGTSDEELPKAGSLTFPPD